MARAPVPPALRKTPYGVSLTRAQRALFQQIGGSRWLQFKLDGIADLLEAISISKNPRKAAPRANLGARVTPGVTLRRASK